MKNKFEFYLLCLLCLTQLSVFGQVIYTVSNNLDSGPGSLRQAIIEANAHQSLTLDTIRFNINGPGPHRISLSSTLPVISDPIYIDGLSQNGSDASVWPYQLMIELSGNNTVTEGLVLTAINSKIFGLVVNEFTQYGIRIVVGGSNLVGACYVGTDVSGLQARPNGLSGIFIGYYSSGNSIGGNWGEYRNLISGNGRSAIILDGNTAGGNKIKGNYIGTDVSGLSALPNGGGKWTFRSTSSHLFE